MRAKCRNGITQIELVFSLSILIVVLTLCTMLFTSSLRKYQATNTIQNTQNNAIMGMDRFAQDFRETTITHLFYYTDPDVVHPDITQNFVYFPSPRDKENKVIHYSSGETRWQSWIVYYVKSPDFQDPSYDILNELLDDKSINTVRVYYLYRKQIYNDKLFVTDAMMSVPPYFAYIRDFSVPPQIVARYVVDFGVRFVPQPVKTLKTIYSFDADIETYGCYQENLYSFRVDRIFTLRDMTNFMKR